MATLELAVHPERDAGKEAALPAGGAGVNPWVVAMTVTLATFMEVLDTSIANVALPHIAGNLGASADESAWVQTSYLVSNAIVLPLSAWLSTRMGRKRFYMTCVAIFTASSMLCGLAHTLPLLIFFRVLQGAGGGGLGPSEQAILADTFEPEQRNMGFAIYGMAIVVAPAIGPTLGGWITDNLSWHWIFFINVPIGILSLFLTQRVVHDPPSARARQGKQGDWLGIATIVVGIGLLQFVLDRGEELDWLASSTIAWAAAISAAALVAMVWREWTHPEPVLELHMLKGRNFGPSVLFNFTLGVVLNGSTILIPLFLQLQLGYSAELAGWALSPAGLTLAVLMPVAGVLASRFDPRKVIAVGFVLTSASLFMMMRVSSEVDFTWVVLMRMFQMTGLPLIFIPITTLSYVGVPAERSNQISSISNFARNLGGSIGVSFLVAFVARHRQISRAGLTAHLQPVNPAFESYVAGIADALHRGGASWADAQTLAMARMNQWVDGQASTLAFIAAFFIMGVIVACLVPLPFLMRKPTKEEMQAGIGGH